MWYRPLEEDTCSPTLEESYRTATTQELIIERGFTRISRAGIPKRPLPNCQAGPTALSTPLFSTPRCRGVGTLRVGQAR